MTQRREASPVRRIFGVIVGSAILAGVMGQIGSHSDNVGLGVAAGAVVGAALGYGVATDRIGRVTLGALIFGLFCCLIGPAVDDYGGNAAVPASVFGAFVGWLGRKRPAR